MQIKTTVRHHLTPVRIAIIKKCTTINVKRRDPPFTVGEKVPWYSHYGEQHGGSLKTENIATVLFSCSGVSNFFRTHGLQHARLPCPSLSPGICSNSSPLSWWCHPTISSSVAPFSCLQYNPAISLLGIYPEKNMIQQDICTPVFIAALFTIAKTWKQFKCPLTEE